MSPDLREPLHDLVSEVPRHVASADLGATAWAAGRRRQLRRRMASTAVTLALMALVVGSLLMVNLGPSAVQPAGTDASPKVDGYPLRIVHRWWVPALPAQPGLIAGLVYRPNLQWDAVSEHGQLWASPVGLGGWGEYPSLSRDGRYLGYLAHRNGPYVVRDLVTGRITRRYPQVSCGCSTPTFSSTKRFFMDGQTPAFWAPDDQRLLLWGGTPGPSQVRALLLEPDGQIRPLRTGSRWDPAGWASPSELVWADRGHRTPAGKVTTIEVTDLSGHPLHKLQVQLPDRTPLSNLDQWSWVVSPNGRKLLLTARTFVGVTYVATYSLQDGSTLTSGQAPNVADADTCPSGWAGKTPVVPALGPSDAAETVTATADPRTVAVTDPMLGSNCVIWASDALAGTPHGGLFGTATAAWTWWWREATVGISGAVVVVLLLWSNRRRRASNTTASTG